MVCRFFDRKSVGSRVNMHGNNKIKENHQLAEKLQKPIIKKIEKRTVHSGLKRNILGADLADLQLIS